MIKTLHKSYYLFLLLAFAVAGVFVFVLNSQASLKKGALFDPQNLEIVALGKSIYNENCATCHGVNLEGQPNWKRPNSQGMLPAPPHDNTGHTWHHTDELLFGITKYGLAEFSGLKNHKTDMPIYKDVLSDVEIIAVLSYIKST